MDYARSREEDFLRNTLKIKNSIWPNFAEGFASTISTFTISNYVKYGNVVTNKKIHL